MANKKWLFSKHTGRNDAQRARLKRFFVDFLGGKCIDCGYSAHLAALDFDHINPKTKAFGISGELRVRGFESLFDEISKCVVRCANCHRIRTHPTATDNKE